jgi:5-methylcytosine-specific restriction endonuclease McrA
MKKSACGNPNSDYYPTIDHIRPLSLGGSDILGNIEICHRDTNVEKANSFPHWKVNGKGFRAERVKGTRTDYEIVKI